MEKHKDLAAYHKPVSNLFSWPEHPDDWEQYRLSEEQVSFFHEHGYVSGIKLMDDAQIKVLQNELEALMNPDHPGHELFYEFHLNESEDADKKIFHSLGQWRVTQAFHDILWNPAFVMAASQLLGNAGVRFWHDQVFYKPPYHGGVVAWHQDYSYWVRTVPMQHLTCWMGLDDADQTNGCLHYVPGSHRWGLLDKPSLTGKMDAIKEVLSPEQSAQVDQAEPIILKKGYAAFHHPLMLHGSYANTSAKPRRAVVLNVFKDGTLSNSETSLLQGVPPVEKGKPLNGKFFPLLYQS